MALMDVDDEADGVYGQPLVPIVDANPEPQPPEDWDNGNSDPEVDGGAALPDEPVIPKRI